MNMQLDKKVLIILGVFVCALLFFAWNSFMRNGEPLVNLPTYTPRPKATATATPNLGVEVGGQVKSPTSGVPNTNPFTTTTPNPFSNYENPFK